MIMEAKAACKLIAPQRMELSARLPIGTKYCVLSLNVDKDGDISELVQRCIQSENLPPYIEQSILSCAAALLEEDRRAQIKESELGMYIYVTIIILILTNKKLNINNIKII
jgi:hypothetical protein